MTMELQRFHATFFAESREGLDVMETGLLQMEQGQHATDIIHSVFRAAHSIKGSAATFGFSRISTLTHVLETLLDELRAGQRQADSELLDALFGAVDGVRALLVEAEHGTPADATHIQAIQQRLSALLTTTTTSATHPACAPDVRADVWNIRFLPHASMFASGNDPLRILRDLHSLGQLEITPLLEALPSVSELDPLRAYLGWECRLNGELTHDQIKQVFAWVDDECELEITPRPAFSPTSSSSPPVSMPATPLRGEIGGQSIRVNVNRIDALMNLLGELVITQAMLKQIGSQPDAFDNERLREGLELLERNTRNLQNAVIHVRMLPIDAVFQRFPRLVRDVSAQLQKKVHLRMLGEGTELDRGLIEKITDPLVHLVRNAIDHGLESPHERRAAGKADTGTLTLAAAQRGGDIIIEVSDDGRGLDHEKIMAKAHERGIVIPDVPTDAQILELIFAPGFSTADSITEVSGRGVGMDVVRRNIQALNGEIQLHSTRGEGTRVVIRLPLSLAILDGMLVQSHGHTLILPLSNVIEALQLRPEDIHTVNKEGRLLRVRDEYLPLLHLMHDEMQSTGSTPQEATPPLAVVVEGNGQKVALEIDDLISQQQVVVKNIETHYRPIDGISGATILGDGQVALIVDVVNLVRTRHSRSTPPACLEAA